MNKELRQFITENFLFGADDSSISDDDSFLEKGIIDSTGVLELVVFLEKRYAIRVRDQDLIPENLDSITNLVNFVQSRRAQVA